jgi:hypothetical protein
MTEDTVQASIEELEASESVAGVLAVVADFNAETGREGFAGALRAARGSTLSAGVVEKLKEWLDKLLTKLRAVASAAGVESFTVTVGSQVSVTCTFGMA